MGDYERAIADYSKAIALNPSDATFYLDRAFALARKGDTDRALVDYGKAIELDPISPVLTPVPAMPIAPEVTPITRWRIFSKAIELDPGKAQRWRSRGIMRFDGGDFRGERPIWRIRSTLRPTPTRCCFAISPRQETANPPRPASQKA